MVARAKADPHSMMFSTMIMHVGLHSNGDGGTDSPAGHTGHDTNGQTGARDRSAHEHGMIPVRDMNLGRTLGCRLLWSVLDLPQK